MRDTIAFLKNFVYVCVRLKSFTMFLDWPLVLDPVDG